MTINTVVYVPEGIVIATDSRLTGKRINEVGIEEQYVMSDNMQKIRLIKNGKIGLALNGNSDFGGKSIHLILGEFEDEINDIESITEIADVLKGFLEINYPAMDVNFVLAGYEENIPYIVQVAPDFIKRINKNQDSGNIEYGVTSFGNIWLVKLLNQNNNVEYNFMTLKDAIEFAEFYENATIQWLRFNTGYSNCGGPVDILVITKEEVFFYKHKLNNKQENRQKVEKITIP